MYDENEVMETEIDESENEELADLEEDEEEITDEGEENQEAAEPETQSAEQNSIFANMRRRAEADAQRKMDYKIAALCKDVTHPITGRPITTFAEYEDAINAQNRIQAERTLNENGLDISLLDEYVNSSPVLAKAQAIIDQNNANQAQAKLMADFEELQRINGDLKTFSDIENINDIVNLVANSNMSIVDAYKIVNFDSLMNKGTRSAKQSAINEARGKSHLAPTNEISEGNDGADISDTMLRALKNNFPDKTEKQLRKLYKQTFK